MTRPEAVVFDLGKVLLDFDYAIAAKALAEHSQAPVQAIQACLDQSPLLLDMEAGRISPDTFHQRVSNAIGYSASQQEFNRAFADIFTEIPEMIRLHAQVAAAAIPTFILSNTNDIAVQHIRARFPFFNRFQGYIFSHEVRCMKPEQRIYEAMESMAGHQGHQLLYIDDRPENIEAALARRWIAVHHTSSRDTVERVMHHLGL